ncbi:serine hydrolase domain-containing protein [Maricaulis sp.]|uniref:serine hydrolase domain-containing protein n=1 Tax=Maricaulis sp. TaxID=1486257 RepID=UPI0025B7CCBA|nr:serine hydrolase domain-containing protein [Maricaulis sp.]
MEQLAACRNPSYLTAMRQLLLPALAACVFNVAALAQTDQGDQIQTRLDAAIADDAAPGLSATLLAADGARIDHQSGFADRRGHVPVDTDTRFLSGSVGKTITALLAVQLANDGVLDLDAPVAPWLSGHDWWPRLANHDALTLRRLLNHSAGVPDYLEDIDFFLAGLTRGARGFTPEETVGFVAGDGPEGPPGAHFSYSDTDYILVGLVIEAVTGEDFYDLAQRRVIGPLELERTEPLQGRVFDDLADGRRGGLFGRRTTARNGRLNENLDHEWTAGGWVTTPGDLAQLYRSLGENGLFAAEGAEMRLDPNPLNATGTSGYGLGLYVRLRDDGTYRIAHGGDFGGYRSAAMYDSGSGLALAVQANDKRFEAPDMAATLLDLLGEN